MVWMVESNAFIKVIRPFDAKIRAIKKPVKAILPADL
jgi:hypothetical protein